MPKRAYSKCITFRGGFSYIEIYLFLANFRPHWKNAKKSVVASVDEQKIPREIYKQAETLVLIVI